MNKLATIMLVACLSITACGRQKLTQIPQPPQGKQAETVQETAPVSSSKWTAAKWTLGVLAVASLSVALGWNWKEKRYFRAKADMHAKRAKAIELWHSDQQILPSSPAVVNSVYTYAFEAINDFAWECKRDEFTNLVNDRDRICFFMMHDNRLPQDTRGYNNGVIIQDSVKTYPSNGERWVKFKQDVGEWTRRRFETLLSHD